ncbi:Extracellular metalloprotease [Tolypocladium ophioglossoides CBS 100239]|uniref:Extracellular metalloprotease n=1 Tax=Tolypocladium ophioglossoides (strain CBS 100239) TaxID=1163406 RepID=A0A0L0NDS6_TOLOC|nr:Extracellular metalloprotease [Tolypocladium ophioglossoides CBS 100239]
MAVKSMLAAGLMATVAMAATLGTQPELFGCGAPAPSEELVEISRQFLIQEAGLNEKSMVSAATIHVDTHVHILASDKSVAGGFVSADTVTKQMKVLNDNFANSGISFTLKSTDWTVNAGWAQFQDQLNMKKQLRKGTYGSLNLYFHTKVDNNLGVCYYPGNVQKGSDSWFQDGCDIISGSMPGGNAQNYNQGKTATHEVGHWFGLLHTFEGGCSGPGDYVDDTPAEASATNGCPIGRNSCPNRPGVDPIHNYMDYSYDSCYYEFTNGQNNRMKNMWQQYRAGK